MCIHTQVGFAGILLYSSFKILTTAGADEEEAEDVSENAIVKFVNRFLESSPSYDGDKFWTGGFPSLPL